MNQKCTKPTNFTYGTDGGVPTKCGMLRAVTLNETSLLQFNQEAEGWKKQKMHPVVFGTIWQTMVTWLYKKEIKL